MNSLSKMIVIVGPTAVGKTALSIELAKSLNGEIINGDSLQVYRTLDIGTAKETIAEREGIPHYLLDVCDVEEDYTASDFKEQARAAVADIISRGKTPIVVGGTGLYIEGLLYDFHFSGEGSNDPIYRARKEAELASSTPEVIWQELQALDPVASEMIHPNNTRRVIRALEVIHATGKPFSANDPHQKDPVYDAYLIGLDTERSVLYDRINQRVTQMMAAGLETEAATLYQRVKGQDAQSIRGIGYKEWIPYFEGHLSREEVCEAIQQNSRRYAKRQLTWFRNRLDGLHWYDLVSHPDQLTAVIDDCRHFIEGGD